MESRASVQNLMRDRALGFVSSVAASGGALGAASAYEAFRLTHARSAVGPSGKVTHADLRKRLCLAAKGSSNVLSGSVDARSEGNRQQEF